MTLEEVPAAEESTAAPEGGEKYWTWPKIAAVSGLTLLVIGLIFLAQYTSRSEQFAENWIGGVGATIAVLNVALTFYLLLVAQHQLRILRQDVKDQEVRHRREIEDREQQRLADVDQARAELEELKRLSQAQIEALSLAQENASLSQQETARARLDLMAPRCSVTLQIVEVNFYESFESQPQLIISKIDIERKSEASKLIEVAMTFVLDNFGNDPVTFATGYPVEPAGTHHLSPVNFSQFTYKVRHDVRTWIEIAQFEKDLTGQPLQKGGAPAVFEFSVPVSTLGGEVTDTHTWSGVVLPIDVSPHSITIESGEHVKNSGSPVARRNREYAALSSVLGLTTLG